MERKWVQPKSTAPLNRHQRINQRILRKLSLSCKYCSGYEEKIVRKDSLPIHKEIADMEKHEIIACIASCLGDSPVYFAKAEQIFNEIKYSVADYVLKHEFNVESGLSVQVAMWLEKRKEPELYKPLEYVINKYLKPEK